MGVPVPQSIIDIYTGRAAYPANYKPTSYSGDPSVGIPLVPNLPWVTNPALIAQITKGVQSASDQGFPGWFDPQVGGGFNIPPDWTVYQFNSPAPGNPSGAAGAGGPVFQLLSRPVPGLGDGQTVYTQPQAIAAGAFAGGLTVKSVPLMIGNQQAYIIDSSQPPPAPPPDRATAMQNVTTALANAPPAPPAPNSPEAIALTQSIAQQVWYPPPPPPMATGVGPRGGATESPPGFDASQASLPGGGGGGGSGAPGDASGAPAAPAAGGAGLVALIVAGLLAAGS